ERRARPRIDIPFVAAAVALQGRARRRLRERRIERLEVARARRLALRLRVEQPVDRLTQNNRLLEFLRGWRLRRLGPGCEVGGRAFSVSVGAAWPRQYRVLAKSRHRSGRLIIRK